MGASSFTGTGVDLWNINKVKNFYAIFTNNKAFTSCNKRKVADAWNGVNKFNTGFPSYKAWAAEPCSAVSGLYVCL